jgi:hypothetical protein
VNVGDLREYATHFETELRSIKQSLHPDAEWYPYSTLSNFVHLDRLLTGPRRELLALARDRPLVDIGAADGDIAWMLDSLGFDVDIVDCAATNLNGLRGARTLKEHLDSDVEILDTDLDSQFALPRRRYGLAFFLGTLYHLQNPFYALRHLAHNAAYAVLSTRVAQVSTDGAVRFAGLPVAYLLDATECNMDATNYWIFSLTGLKRMLDRTGWEVLELTTVGQTVDSDPASADRDERAFCLLRSRVWD